MGFLTLTAREVAVPLDQVEAFAVNSNVQQTQSETNAGHRLNRFLKDLATRGLKTRQSLEPSSVSRDMSPQIQVTRQTAKVNLLHRLLDTI